MTQSDEAEPTRAVVLRMTAAEGARLDAWAARQPGRPTRETAALTIIRQAIGATTTSDGHGLKPEELNAENDG